MSELHRAINETIEIGRRYSHLTVEDIQKYFGNETKEEKYLMHLGGHLKVLADKKLHLKALTESYKEELKERSAYLNNFSEIRGSLSEFESYFNLEISKYNEMHERFIIIYNEYEKNLKKIQEKFVKTRNDIQNINFNSDMQYIIFNNFLLMHFNDQGHKRDEEYENIELTTEELILLFKGVAIGEVYLRGGNCNGYASVSGTTMVLHKLITIDREKAKEAWEWTRNFGLCKDEYLPNPTIDF